MKRIALFLPNWIGDVVMATPAIRAVYEAFPAAKLVGVARSYVAAVMEGSPWFDRIILHDKRGRNGHTDWGVVRELRREPIDAAILFPNSFRTALFALLGGCRRRIGYARYGRNLLLTDRLYPLREARGGLKPVPIIHDYNRLVCRLDIPQPSTRMELFTTPRDESAADSVWQSARFQENDEVICLNSGGAFGASKHWPVEHFAELSRQLIDRRGSKILVICGPAEKDLAQRIVAETGRTGITSLATSEVSLGLSKACIRRSSLLITTDSGPRHFAAAFDRPVITLFGPTHIEWTETYFEKAIHLQKKVPCGPCQLRVCPLDHRCMKELRPDEVFSQASTLLSRFPPAKRMLRHAS